MCVCVSDVALFHAEHHQRQQQAAGQAARLPGTGMQLRDKQIFLPDAAAPSLTISLSPPSPSSCGRQKTTFSLLQPIIIIMPVSLYAPSVTTRNSLSLSLSPSYFHPVSFLFQSFAPLIFFCLCKHNFSLLSGSFSLSVCRDSFARHANCSRLNVCLHVCVFVRGLRVCREERGGEGRERKDRERD